VALKLVRYAKKDPDDSAAVLRLGSLQRGYRWTVDVLERWLSERCWPMQYSKYPPQQKAQLRERLQDALTRAFPESQSPTMYHTRAAQTQAQAQTRTQIHLRSPSSMSALSPPSHMLSPFPPALLFAPLQQQLPQAKGNIPLYFL